MTSRGSPSMTGYPDCLRAAKESIQGRRRLGVAEPRGCRFSEPFGAPEPSLQQGLLPLLPAAILQSSAGRLPPNAAHLHCWLARHVIPATKQSPGMSVTLKSSGCDCRNLAEAHSQVIAATKCPMQNESVASFVSVRYLRELPPKALSEASELWLVLRMP